jgi:hypothetical protein
MRNEVMTKYLAGKDVKGSCGDLFKGTVSVFT